MDLIEKLMLVAENKLHKIRKFVIPKLNTELVELQAHHDRMIKYGDELEQLVKRARLGEEEAIEGLVQHAFNVKEF